jgi:GNAT superfamily N-acetyltransferase
MFRLPEPEESSALVRLAEATGIFQAGEAAALLEPVLADWHAGELGDHHSVLVWSERPDREAVGWVYVAPVEHTDGVWNLWWIGVTPQRQRTGIGTAMLTNLEAYVRAHRGRLLLIETSSLPPFEGVRSFYTSRGYTASGCLPDYYAVGDGKITFFKRI